MILKFIKKYLIPYGVALAILTVLGLLFLEHVALPFYVGYNDEIYLPDVRGEFLHAGKKTLNNKDFNVDIILVPYNENNQPGKIIKMFPRAFTKIKNNRRITLTVAGHEEDIATPDFKGLTLRNAKIKITKFNLKLDTILYEFNSEYDNNFVSFQIPRDGRIIKTGHKVTIGVSKGSPPNYYMVPDLRGKSLHTAKLLISNSGLRLGKIKYEYYPDFMINTVIEQSLTEGMSISFPSRIDLILSTDKEP